MAVTHSTILRSGPVPPSSHTHAADEACPTCDQPIPRDRADEIKARIETRERERTAEIAARLKDQFAREKSEALDLVRQEAQAALDQQKKESAAHLDAARAEERQAAALALQEKLAEAQRATEKAQAALRLQLGQAEAAKSAAQQAGAALQAQLDQLRQDNEAALEKLKKDFAGREESLRQEAMSAAQAALEERIKEAEQAKSDAEAKATTAEKQLHSLQEAHDARLAERLLEQREALERARTEEVNAVKSAAFEEKQKLSDRLQQVQRQLEKKTADELGEGAEVNLFEELKAEFEGDRIERVGKGQQGADILHVVVHNGQECGKIIYDSKDHNAWRNDFVTKLASDQMAARAEHAILSTRKFPAGMRQVHVQDDVIIANPARVVAIVQIVRQHLVQSHTLRRSNQERAQKTAALYDFITSERCANLLTRIETHTDELLDLQVKEKKAHDNHWKQEGRLYRSIQKVKAELTHEIDSIIGTADARGQAVDG